MQKIAGGPSPMGVNMMRAGAQAGAVGTSNRYHWQQPIGGPNAGTDFPIVPVGPDGYDDVANIKNEYAHLTGAAGGATNWVVPFEQADAAYLMRKRDQEEKAQFDMWIQQKYNLADPAQNMMLQQIAPELYQRREEVIDTQQDMVSRYAKMRLRGAKSLEDLYFEWLVETQRMDLPKGPIWNPKAWRLAQSNNPNEYEAADRRWNENRYYAGFFSPLKWMSATQSGQQANAANYFDITGTGVQYQNRTAGSTYVGSGTSYAARYPNVYTPIPAAHINAVQADNNANPAILGVAAVPASAPRNF